MTDTSDVQPPKIESPCECYPIKVIGDAGEGSSDLVVEIIQRHAPDLGVEILVARDGSKGRFLSVQVLIITTDVDQLQAIYNDLRATGRAHVVL